MKITRRHVLAASALAAGAGAVGATVIGGTAASWWKRPAAEGYKVLSEEEGAFLRAFADTAYPATTAIPHAGGTLDLDRYVDANLSHMAETQRNLVKVLLHALDSWPMPARRQGFVALDAPQRAEVLHHWLTHFRGEVRQAATSLVLLVGMGYTTHPDVAPFFAALHQCGYAR
jgi:hypothetical protein